VKQLCEGIGIEKWSNMSKGTWTKIQRNKRNKIK
jgi:hypothetical protein